MSLRKTRATVQLSCSIKTEKLFTWMLKLINHITKQAFPHKVVFVILVHVRLILLKWALNENGQVTMRVIENRFKLNDLCLIFLFSVTVSEPPDLSCVCVSCGIRPLPRYIRTGQLQTHARRLYRTYVFLVIP